MIEAWGARLRSRTRGHAILSSIENNLGSLRSYQRVYGHNSKDGLDSFTSHQEWHSYISAIKTFLPTPVSATSLSYQTDVDSVAPSDPTGATPSSGRSFRRSLVEHPLYRDMNLAANNIYMRHPCDSLPEHVASSVDYVRQDRDSPGPSSDEIRQERDLSMGTAEPEVERHFHAYFFPDPKSSDSLKRSDRQPMAKHTVPSAGPKFKVSTPVPDMIYGYNREHAFPRRQAQLIPMGTEIVANNQYLLYPFFIVEFKGDGGSMWVATNQCLGGSASCVNIAERLNSQLQQCNSDNVCSIDSTAFSIAMNGTEARLYISWEPTELKYYMANVKSFLLQDPAHYSANTFGTLMIFGNP
ncbi:hypothetical protein F4823DRAFT_614360 [Ustulina deusta]|nr:hypothetical protein F4823DRAFT_614360 [Ustulina deusta]